MLSWLEEVAVAEVVAAALVDIELEQHQSEHIQFQHLFKSVVVVLQNFNQILPVLVLLEHLHILVLL